MQIKLLKILALLGSGDKNASGHMYTVVHDIIRKADLSTNIGNAVLYEAVCCAAGIHPNTKLLEATADAMSRFLKVCRIVAAYYVNCLSDRVFLWGLFNIYVTDEQSDSHNLKYMGIDALGRLIKLSPEIAEQHQLAVIDCLEAVSYTHLTLPTNREV